MSHNLKDCTTSTAPSLLLVDARSYTAAFANRAKGGGCEYQGKFYFQLYFILSCFAIGNEGLQDKNEIVLDIDRQCQQCHLFQTINLDGGLNVITIAHNYQPYNHCRYYYLQYEISMIPVSYTHLTLPTKA